MQPTPDSGGVGIISTAIITLGTTATPGPGPGINQDSSSSGSTPPPPPPGATIAIAVLAVLVGLLVIAIVLILYFWRRRPSSPLLPPQAPVASAHSVIGGASSPPLPLATSTQLQQRHELL